MEPQGLGLAQAAELGDPWAAAGAPVPMARPSPRHFLQVPGAKTGGQDGLRAPAGPRCPSGRAPMDTRPHRASRGKEEGEAGTCPGNVWGHPGPLPLGGCVPGLQAALKPQHLGRARRLGTAETPRLTDEETGKDETGRNLHGNSLYFSSPTPVPSEH